MECERRDPFCSDGLSAIMRLRTKKPTCGSGRLPSRGSDSGHRDRLAVLQPAGDDRPHGAGHV